jgi:inhibitor of KinA
MKEVILNDVILLNESILANSPDSMTEVIQSINSITVLYDPQSITFRELKSWLEKLYKKTPSVRKTSSTLWKVPVCYDQTFGLDLQELSDRSGLPIDEIVNIHSESVYKVYSIGFLPGFLYLGGLDEQLHIGRKSTPRLDILKGAVGIGGEQTGIYPTASPGGWQIIGNTPISLFDINKDSPCFAKSGDNIQFIPVSLSEYKAIVELIALDSYKLEKEVLND